MQTANPPDVLPLILDRGFPPARAGCDVGPELPAATAAVEAEIRHRAFAIWVAKDRPRTSALADWLQAEAEVRAEH